MSLPHRGPTSPTLAPARPVVPVVALTSDPVLAAELHRLAAAAGTPVEVVAPAEGVRRWSAPAVLLVGADQASAAAALAPARRPGVHVVALGPAPEHLFRVAVELGADSVLELPEAAGWLMQLLADGSEGQQETGTVVAVTGGSGGVGASVLAAALAAVAGRRGRAALLDLDPVGPGSGRLLGLEEQGGATWGELAQAPGRLGARALREALPHRDGVGVLGWAPGQERLPPATSLREVVEAARRGHAWVVLDVPRSPFGPPDEVLTRCDHVLLVVRAALGPVVSAARVTERLLAGAVPVEVVVRTRRSDPATAADVARAVGAPLAGNLPDQRRLDEHLDLGAGPVVGRRAPLTRLAEALVERWGARP